MARRDGEERDPGGLLARIRELEALLASHEDVQALVEDLQVHQEEVRVQNAQLLEAQRELEASRDRYAELYDFAPVPFAALDPNGVVLHVNLAAARLLGAERVRLVGVPLVVQVAEGSQRPFLQLLARLRRREAVGPIELELTTAEGVVPVELTAKRIDSQLWSRPSFYTTLQDLRERRRIESERLQAAFEGERLRHQESAARAASEAKDRFLAVLSHELRTPLTPVLLTLEALERSPEDAELHRRSLELIRRNLLIEMRLIDDLLDLTRIERNKLHLEMERVDLHEVIRYAAAMCEGDVQARQLTLRLRLDATESFVRGDATRLQQVFWNLIRNAVRYTPNGGQVGVHTSRESNGGCLSVDVSDTGRGIAAEDLERVFQPFEQAGSQQAGGLGLGLAICRGLVEAHGGMIRAQSEGLDRGATFNVELPRSADPASAQLGAAARKRGGSAALRVLLVEDNRDTAEALGVLLQLEGYEVDVAYTVDDARRLAQAGFDVLLSDLQLPDGSGLELMRELASEGEVHGIAMSGFGALTDLQRSREAGFEAHLVKPVEFAKVLEAIEDVAPRG